MLSICVLPFQNITIHFVGSYSAIHDPPLMEIVSEYPAVGTDAVILSESGAITWP